MLTPKEKTLLHLLLDTGASNLQLSLAMGTTEQTTKNHLRSILEKKRCHSRTHLVVKEYKKILRRVAA